MVSILALLSHLGQLDLNKEFGQTTKYLNWFPYCISFPQSAYNPNWCKCPCYCACEYPECRVLVVSFYMVLLNVVREAEGLSDKRSMTGASLILNDSFGTQGPRDEVLFWEAGKSLEGVSETPYLPHSQTVSCFKPMEAFLYVIS